MCVKMRKKLVFLLLFLSIFDVQSQYDIHYDGDIHYDEENNDENFVARDIDEESNTCRIRDPKFDGYEELDCNINGI